VLADCDNNVFEGNKDDNDLLQAEGEVKGDLGVDEALCDLGAVIGSGSAGSFDVRGDVEWWRGESLRQNRGVVWGEEEDGMEQEEVPKAVVVPHHQAPSNSRQVPNVDRAVLIARAEVEGLQELTPLQLRLLEKNPLLLQNIVKAFLVTARQRV
jgi:hypothetical protein